MSVTLMGSFALRKSGQRQPLRLSQATAEALAFLFSHANRNLRREQICDQIWPDIEDARSALNTALWRIKKRIAEFDGVEIHQCDQLVGIGLSPSVKLDIVELEACALCEELSFANVINDTLRRQCETILADCRGCFLDGTDCTWALALRERYNAYIFKLRHALMRDAHHRHRLEDALLYGRAILQDDPFREETQREVMRLYVENGQRVEAMRQYRRLRDILEQDLDIEPMPDTQALYSDICSGRYPSPAPRQSELKF